jgi:hypothetical protein
MHRSNTPAVHALHALGHLVVDITGPEHRPGLVLPILGRQTAGDSVLAVAENFGVVSIHSKWPFVDCWSFYLERILTKI